MNTLTIIATTITSVTVVISLIFKIYSTIHSLENKITSWEENLNKNTLYILKLAVFSEGLPNIDRIQAGQQYLDVKHDYLVEKK